MIDALWNACGAAGEQDGTHVLWLGCGRGGKGGVEAFELGCLSNNVGVADALCREALNRLLSKDLGRIERGDEPDKVIWWGADIDQRRPPASA